MSWPSSFTDGGFVAAPGGAGVVEDLSVFFEAGFEFVVGDFLDGGVGFEGEDCGGGGALAEDHEDGFHSDAAVGDVGGGAGDGD